MKKLFIVLTLILTVYLIEAFSLQRWKSDLFTFDVAGYYIYLPAVFIYNDLPHLDYYSYVDDTYHPTGAKAYAIFPQAETGKKAIKYSMGVAIGELPLFLAAQAYVNNSKDYKADGYTIPYRSAVVFSTLLWTMIGLFFLGRFLMNYYNATTAALTLLIIAFGTNLYAYTVVDVGMSHAWMFLLFSVILYHTERLYRSFKPRHFYWLGAFIGLATLSRPTDVLIVLVPLLWGISSRDLRIFLGKNIDHLAGGAVSFLAVMMLLFSYWKYTTGHWLHFSYEGEVFDFLDPEIFNGLFSYRKGWFLYTPVAFIGMLGLMPLYRYNRNMALIVALFFALTIYVVFSWACWFYGWSFGCRALVEALAVLSIPLGAIIHFLVARKNWWLRSIAIAVFGFFIWLNIYQTHQYMEGALPGDSITKEYYWRVWNVMHATDEDRKFLN